MMIAQLENIQQELNDFVERTREEMEQVSRNTNVVSFPSQTRGYRW